ncbi:DinB family protein [Pyxidicoccus trucidator]|uniref:DinB family protein n=1 Tax=Pyxidicoccus trucidator TaxID=2709662 RepID=UPI0013DC9F0F|nr:DinB family protein [Pyxidicoccus trucidator]
MTAHTPDAATPPELESAVRIRAHKQFFRRTLQAFQDQDAAFQPRPGMLSVAGHVHHVTAGLELFLAGVFPAMERFQGREWKSRRGEGQVWLGLGPGFTSMEWTKVSNENLSGGSDAESPLAFALRAFDETMDLAAELYGQLSREELLLPLPENPIRLRTPQEALEIMIDHTAHHRGALAQYARLLDREPKIPYFEMSEAMHEEQLLTGGRAP